MVTTTRRVCWDHLSVGPIDSADCVLYRGFVRPPPCKIRWWYWWRFGNWKSITLITVAIIVTTSAEVTWSLMLRDAYVYAPVNWVIIGSGNGSAPVWHQAITWTNADLLPIGPLGTNFIDIWIKIQNLLSRKCIWKCRLQMPNFHARPNMLKSGTLYYITHCIQVSVPTPWIRNYIHCKVWDEITRPLPNVNGATSEVWE